MKSFKTFINEMFNNDIQFKIIKIAPHAIIYEFYVDKNLYEVFFDVVYDEKKTNYYEVTFIKKTDKSYHQGITNDGVDNALKVFGTVVEIIKDFITKKNPTELIFVADKGKHGENLSRSKLYTTMLRRFVPAGYKSFQNNELDKKTFSIKRIK